MAECKSILSFRYPLTSNLPALAFVNNVLDGDVVSLWDKPLHHLDEVGVGGQKGQSIMGMGPVSDTKHIIPLSFTMRTSTATHLELEH